MDSQKIALLLAGFLSAAPIVVSMLVREAVRNSRHEHVKNLDFVLYGRSKRQEAPEDQSAADGRFITALEFLKFKYDVIDADSPRSLPEPIHPQSWLVAGLSLFLLLCAILGTVAIIATDLGCDLSNAEVACWRKFLSAHHAICFVIFASVAGAYTFMIRAFQQAIHNFDLEPSSFFGAANNLIFGITVTQITTFYLAKEVSGFATLTGILMIVAFIGSYMPDDILRYFLSLSSVKQLKEERSDFGQEIQSIPVEVIDGIDSKVRFRLADFHIESVQHLASANPLMLFVETPYGLFETLNWVSQAQLCASVGPDMLFKLWKVGIKTIFDLERAVLGSDGGVVNIDNMRAIERIILPDLATASPWSSHALIANVQMRVGGTETRRLRQIVNRINHSLGLAAATLS